MNKFRRKLYTRGSSYETTIPMPLLFKTNLDKKQDILFEYDETNERWYLEIVERGKKPKKTIDKTKDPLKNLKVDNEIKKILEKNIKELLQEQKK